jgi:hypothetical protein
MTRNSKGSFDELSIFCPEKYEAEITNLSMNPGTINIAPKPINKFRF